jgi:hypothetical protein
VIRAGKRLTACTNEVEFEKELSDVPFNVVSDRSDIDNVTTGGIVELPGFVPLAGEERAGVAAAHGDHDVCGADCLVGPRLGELLGDIDATFGHRIAAMADALTSRPGSDPPDQPTASTEFVGEPRCRTPESDGGIDVHRGPGWCCHEASLVVA